MNQLREIHEPRVLHRGVDPRESRLSAVPSVSRRNTTESILATLERGTEAQYRTIEDLVPLMSEDVSMIDYCWYLTKMLAYSAPMERRFAELPGLAAAVPDLQRREKAGLIRDDLGLLESISTGPLFPRCDCVPAICSTAEGLGAMYVLEASTLGGQFTSRHLAERLGVQPGKGASFIASYRDMVRPMWRSFGQSIELYAKAHPEDIGQIVSAARTTFSTLERWFRSVDRPQGLAR